METVFDYRRLRGKITEVCGTLCEFSLKMQISRASLSQKLNGKSYFSQEEILRACEILGISHSNIHLYFFTVKV